MVRPSSIVSKTPSISNLGFNGIGGDFVATFYIKAVTNNTKVHIDICDVAPTAGVCVTATTSWEKMTLYFKDVNNYIDVSVIAEDSTAVVTGIGKIEFVNTEDQKQLIEAIIKANKNLKDSTEARDWELIGSDMERLQKLIDQLEQVNLEQEEKDKKMENY